MGREGKRRGGWKGEREGVDEGRGKVTEGMRGTRQGMGSGGEGRERKKSKGREREKRGYSPPTPKKQLQFLERHWSFCFVPCHQLTTCLSLLRSM